MNTTDIDTTKLLIVFAQQLIQHLTVVALLGDEGLNRLGSFLRIAWFLSLQHRL